MIKSLLISTLTALTALLVIYVVATYRVVETPIGFFVVSKTKADDLFPPGEGMPWMGVPRSISWSVCAPDVALTFDPSILCSIAVELFQIPHHYWKCFRYLVAIPLGRVKRQPAVLGRHVDFVFVQGKLILTPHLLHDLWSKVLL